MMDKLYKALQIAKISGDKVIVVDSANPDADAFVVMGLKDYEDIMSTTNKDNPNVRNLTEEQLIDKINCDIALWKNEDLSEDVLDDAIKKEKNLADLADKQEESEVVEENMYYYPDESLSKVYESSGQEELEENEGYGDQEDKEEHSEFQEKESLFEKFAREEERQREKRNRGWEIPFEVKKNADEIQE